MCEFSDNTYLFSRRQHVELAADMNIDGVLDNALNQLYNDRDVNDATKQKLFESHYKPLKQAVDEGYGKPLIKIEYGTPNYEFLKNLQINTAVFAAFKNHAAVKEMAALLKDKDGNLRTREDFKREALKVDATYRGSHLDTEYDTAVRQARMAANWQKYQSTKHLYPNLKYVRTKANRPDAMHLAYVGVIRSIDDPFWDTHYPPNRWRCQCSVEPTHDDETDIPSNLPPIPKEFAFNSGRQQQVFDLKNSDYIKSLSAKEQPAEIKRAEKYVVTQAIKEAEYQQLYKSRSGGGKVEAHPLTFDNTDFDDMQRVARLFANKGHDVKMLPTIGNTDLRKGLIPDGAKPGKSPDFLIDGNIVADAKKITGTSKNTIGHSLSEAKSQCNNAIVDIPEGSPLTKYQVVKRIIDKMNKPEMKDFGNVWVIYKSELLKNPHKK